ncbi:hypothetical protein [Thermoflavifilum thermophilum]|uniref:DUF4386 domain-containing protein n=1 Tax=Thermoflavifilum thermophilum TaxID=1393122 RepID=A0A1I7NFD0_9BACT|nr:hypothetical protein [Thermoflavifilum thermophilum]SFV33374.1 hypothetical protein SAMN05660895_1667 [Thermoflavifilum thermophilum]
MKRQILIRTFCILSAIVGILGVLMIGNSFSINTGPPLNATNEQLILFAKQNYQEVLKGAWLQAVGTFLIIVFAIAIVHLAEANNTFSGWMTLLGSATLVMVSLTEVVCYIMALFTVPETMGAIGNNIGHAVQHLYFIVAAPSLFLPLAFVILSSNILPRVFGYLAIILGIAFFAVGISSLYRLILSSLDTSLAAIQALWWFAAAIVLIARSKKIANSRKENIVQ